MQLKTVSGIVFMALNDNRLASQIMAAAGWVVPSSSATFDLSHAEEFVYISTHSKWRTTDVNLSDLIRREGSKSMKRDRWLAILIVAVAGLIWSCGDDDQITNSEPSEDIMPLAIGNQWRSEVLRVDSAGDTVSLDSQSTIIVGDTTISGQTWFRYQTDYIQSSDLPVLRMASDGLWVSGPDATDAAYLLAKYPCNTGDTWTNAAADDTITVRGTKVSVTVPAGTYECVQYAIHRPSGDSTVNYYAPGTGLVKQTFFVVSRTHSEYRTELLSATVK
jgi:hypothetical protein